MALGQGPERFLRPLVLPEAYLKSKKFKSAQPLLGSLCAAGLWFRGRQSKTPNPQINGSRQMLATFHPVLGSAGPEHQTGEAVSSHFPARGFRLGQTEADMETGFFF